MDKLSVKSQDTPIETIVQQAWEIINCSGDGEEELSEEQLDLVVAAVTAPDYQQFIQSAWEKRGVIHGTQTDR